MTRRLSAVVPHPIDVRHSATDPKQIFVGKAIAYALHYLAPQATVQSFKTENFLDCIEPWAWIGFRIRGAFNITGTAQEQSKWNFDKYKSWTVTSKHFLLENPNADLTMLPDVDVHWVKDGKDLSNIVIVDMRRVYHLVQLKMIKVMHKCQTGNGKAFQKIMLKTLREHDCIIAEINL